MTSDSLVDINVLKESGRLYKISRETWVTDLGKGQSEPVESREIQTGQ
jgi:hypothetical protein